MFFFQIFAGYVQRRKAWKAPGSCAPRFQSRDQVPSGHAEAR